MAVMAGCAVFDGFGFGEYLWVLDGVGFGLGFGEYLLVLDGVGFGLGFGEYLFVLDGVGLGFGEYLLVLDGVGFGFGEYLFVLDGDGFGECLSVIDGDGFGECSVVVDGDGLPVIVVGDGLSVIVDGDGLSVIVFDVSDAVVEGVVAGDPVAATAVPPAVPPDSRAAVRVPTAKVRPQWLRNVAFTMFSHLEQLPHWSLSASTEVRSVPPDRRPEHIGSHFQQKWRMPVRGRTPRAGRS
ncbi:hypothetical protein [Streptomyces olivochromogenes]|uniref:hypothetical protein n=1 Tax=Streptomyces olivochromogenes TaxID=1963 RepID=UPI00131B9C38|nr:hypothetical protein [Streptomyces olivochromogenes]